jgi:hypothetical protein
VVQGEAGEKLVVAPGHQGLGICVSQVIHQPLHLLDGTPGFGLDLDLVVKEFPAPGHVADPVQGQLRQAAAVTTFFIEDPDGRA